jgi:hypothetical protein
MSEEPTPAAAAQAIAGARDRLAEFARSCTPAQWSAAPLTGGGDSRPVGVVVDHVGHAYEYIGDFIAAIVRGDVPQIDNQVIDGLNAEHSVAAVGVDAASAVARLQRSGDALVGLVASLSDEQLGLMQGRVRRLAQIAARHADDHRTELEEALGAGA